MKKKILFLQKKKKFQTSYFSKDKECQINCKLIYKWTNPAKTKENYGLSDGKMHYNLSSMFLEKENRHLSCLSHLLKFFFFYDKNL